LTRRGRAARWDEPCKRNGTCSLEGHSMDGEQAELSFPLMMQVRNGMVEAYQEVLRMQM